MKKPNAVQKQVYDIIAKHTTLGEALNAFDVAEHAKLTPGRAKTALERLVKLGLAHRFGRDRRGITYAAGTPEKGLYENPAKGKKAEKKAKAWYGRPSLLTAAVPVSIPDDVELVDVGEILAIEYLSDKFDGNPRAYRHDVTKKRRLYISTDGSVLVIKPGFKITRRGIEG